MNDAMFTGQTTIERETGDPMYVFQVGDEKKAARITRDALDEFDEDSLIALAADLLRESSGDGPIVVTTSIARSRLGA
jgi:hypothetical protein